MWWLSANSIWEAGRLRIQGHSGPHSKTPDAGVVGREEKRGGEEEEGKGRGKREGEGKPTSYLNQLVKPICKCWTRHLFKERCCDISLSCELQVEGGRMISKGTKQQKGFLGLSERRKKCNILFSCAICAVNIHVCVPMLICVGAHACVCACGGQRCHLQ